MDAALRQFVRERAGHRCEYCQLPQSAIDGVLQIEHVIAKQHLGGDGQENLALACDQCNLHKGTNLSAIDPISGAIVALFHPRTERWAEHFDLIGAEILGQTAVGRATARLLKMNARLRLQFRAILIATGQW